MDSGPWRNVTLSHLVMCFYKYHAWLSSVMMVPRTEKTARQRREGRKERLEGGVQEVGCSDKKTSHSQKCRSPSRMNRVQAGSIWPHCAVQETHWEGVGSSGFPGSGVPGLEVGKQKKRSFQTEAASHLGTQTLVVCTRVRTRKHSAFLVLLSQNCVSVFKQ